MPNVTLFFALVDPLRSKNENMNMSINIFALCKLLVGITTHFLINKMKLENPNILFNCIVFIKKNSKTHLPVHILNRNFKHGQLSAPYSKDRTHQYTPHVLFVLFIKLID